MKPFFEKGKKSLYWYDEIGTEIYVFDLLQQKLERTIPLQREGPEGIGKITGYSIFSSDYIYISTMTSGEILVIDDKGKLRDRINYRTNESAKQINNLVLLNSNAWNDIYHLDNKVIVPLRTPFFKEKPLDNKWKEMKIFFDVKSNNDTCQINLPNLSFNDKGQRILSALTSSQLNGKIYFALTGDHKIYRTDGCSVEKSSFSQSQYASKMFGMTELSEFSEYLCKTFMYGNIYADPHQRRIYRISVLPYDEGSYDCRDRMQFPQAFSIMVFDEELNLLQEVKISDKKYSIIHAFVDERGLNLMRSPYHEGYDEDLLIFDGLLFN